MKQKKNIWPWIELVLLVAVFVIVLINTIIDLRKPNIDTSVAEEGIKKVQKELIDIKDQLEIEKQKRIDTLIIEKLHEKEIIKQLQAVNNTFNIKESTIVVMPITDTFARKFFDELIFKDKQGYIDIPN